MFTPQSNTDNNSASINIKADNNTKEDSNKNATKQSYTSTSSIRNNIYQSLKSNHPNKNFKNSHLMNPINTSFTKNHKSHSTADGSFNNINESIDVPAITLTEADNISKIRKKTPMSIGTMTAVTSNDNDKTENNMVNNDYADTGSHMDNNCNSILLTKAHNVPVYNLHNNNDNNNNSNNLNYKKKDGFDNSEIFFKIHSSTNKNTNNAASFNNNIINGNVDKNHLGLNEFFQQNKINNMTEDLETRMKKITNVSKGKFSDLVFSQAPLHNMPPNVNANIKTLTPPLPPPPPGLSFLLSDGSPSERRHSSGSRSHSRTYSSSALPPITKIVTNTSSTSSSTSSTSSAPLSEVLSDSSSLAIKPLNNYATESSCETALKNGSNNSNNGHSNFLNVPSITNFTEVKNPRLRLSSSSLHVPNTNVTGSLDKMKSSSSLRKINSNSSAYSASRLQLTPSAGSGGSIGSNLKSHTIMTGVSSSPFHQRTYSSGINNINGSDDFYSLNSKLMHNHGNAPTGSQKNILLNDLHNKNSSKRLVNQFFEDFSNIKSSDGVRTENGGNNSNSKNPDIDNINDNDLDINNSNNNKPNLLLDDQTNNSFLIDGSHKNISDSVNNNDSRKRSNTLLDDEKNVFPFSDDHPTKFYNTSDNSKDNYDATTINGNKYTDKNDTNDNNVITNKITNDDHDFINYHLMDEPNHLKKIATSDTNYMSYTTPHNYCYNNNNGYHYFRHDNGDDTAHNEIYQDNTNDKNGDNLFANYLMYGLHLTGFHNVYSPHSNRRNHRRRAPSSSGRSNNQFWTPYSHNNFYSSNLVNNINKKINNTPIPSNLATDDHLNVVDYSSRSNSNWSSIYTKDNGNNYAEDFNNNPIINEYSSNGTLLETLKPHKSRDSLISNETNLNMLYPGSGKDLANILISEDLGKINKNIRDYLNNVVLNKTNYINNKMQLLSLLKNQLKSSNEQGDQLIEDIENSLNERILQNEKDLEYFAGELYKNIDSNNEKLKVLRKKVEEYSKLLKKEKERLARIENFVEVLKILDKAHKKMKFIDKLAYQYYSKGGNKGISTIGGPKFATFNYNVENIMCRGIVIDSIIVIISLLFVFYFFI